MSRSLQATGQYRRCKIARLPSSLHDRQLTEEEQRKVGVAPEAIRLSVGIEDIEDILADLDQALAKAV